MLYTVESLVYVISRSIKHCQFLVNKKIKKMYDVIYGRTLIVYISDPPKNELLNRRCCYHGSHGRLCCRCSKPWSVQRIRIRSTDDRTTNLHRLRRQGQHLHHWRPEELPHDPRRSGLRQSYSDPGNLLCLNRTLNWPLCE